MLCSICKEREATVHLTQITGDRMQKVDVCKECSETTILADPTGFSISDLLLSMNQPSRPRISE
jgi:protein arginine kinase activator